MLGLIAVIAKLRDATSNSFYTYPTKIDTLEEIEGIKATAESENEAIVDKINELMDANDVSAFHKANWGLTGVINAMNDRDAVIQKVRDLKEEIQPWGTDAPATEERISVAHNKSLEEIRELAAKVSDVCSRNLAIVDNLLNDDTGRLHALGDRIVANHQRNKGLSEGPTG